MRLTLHGALFLILISQFTNTANAQISGILKNSVTYEPVDYALILIKNTSTGTQSNKSGYFEIKQLKLPAIATISKVGYKSKTVEINRSNYDDLVILLEPEVINLDELIIFPDRTTNPFTSSSTIARTSIPLVELQKRIASTGAESFRAEQGVFVQQTSVGQGSIYIRGRAGRDVLYLFNGLRMNPSFVRSGQNQYFGAIDPLLLERFDLFRGPVSLFYGSDALSGGVNSSPIVKDFTTESSSSAEVISSFNFGGNGEKMVHANTSFQGERFTLFAGGTYKDFDYYRMSDKTNDLLWFPYTRRLSNADYQFKSFLVSSKIKSSENSEVSLLTYYGEVPDAPRFDRITLGYSFETADDLISPRNGYLSNTAPLSFWANTLDYKIKLDKAFVDVIEAKFGYFQLRDHRRDQRFLSGQSPSYSVLSGSSSFDFALNENQIFEKNTSNQILGSVDFFSTLNKNILLKWGTDVSYDITSSSEFNTNGDSFLSRYPDGSSYLSTGVFAQINHKLTNRLVADYGIRYSHIFADLAFEGVFTERQFDPFKTDYGQVTGSLGLNYELTNDINLVSNFSTGFRAPNIADLAEVGQRGNGLFQTTTINLKPEKTFNIDAGIRVNASQFNLELFAFWLHYYDNINQNPTGNIVDADGNFIRNGINPGSEDEFREVVNVNQNSLDVLGIELKSDYVVSSKAKYGFTFNYIWGEETSFDGTKAIPNRIPPANGLVYLRVSAGRSFIFQPQVRYALAKRNLSDEEIQDNRVSISGTDGFTNLQFLATYIANQDLLITLKADNLSNAAYREHASSLDGMARNFSVSMSYNF